LGTRMQAHHEIDALVAAIVDAAQPDDHILIMSNGGFAGIHARLLDALSSKR
ncbi:MAG: UDP-N-acetylmuramate:L-alanyl-gamma-D-glutamyl-meso-diaminopimelate ligase, partial [Pseudomonadota bacterium]